MLVLLLCSCYSFSFSCYPMIHFILPFLTLSVYLCFIYVLSVCIFFFITLCLLHLVSSSFSTLLYTSPYSFSFPPSLPCLYAFLSYCYYYNNSYWYCCDSKHRWNLMRIVPDITQVFSAAWGRHAGYVHPSSRKTSSAASMRNNISTTTPRKDRYCEPDEANTDSDQQEIKATLSKRTPSKTRGTTVVAYDL